MRRAAIPVMVLLSVLVANRNSHAAELVHRVGGNESLDVVAKNYYGASWKKVYIIARNRLAADTKVGGKRIIVPAAWNYRVRSGDSLARIAKTHLGNTDRHVAIMQFNGIKSATDLAVGQQLAMPFHLFHDVKSGDTLSSISRRYYRNTRRTTMLKEYNGIDTLKEGSRLVVPIFDPETIDVRSRRYNAKRAESTPRPPPPSAADAPKRLRTAVSHYRDGTFDNACDELESLLEANVLQGGDQITMFKFLGFCAIANDDNPAARDYFRKWIELQPKASLDPIQTSPKILAVFHEVVESTGQPDNGASTP